MLDVLNLYSSIPRLHFSYFLLVFFSSLGRRNKAGARLTTMKIKTL